MRVRGLWFRGLGAPRGDRRLDLSGAFTCVECRELPDARGFAWLLRAILHPARELTSLQAWSPGTGARVVAWLARGAESYRLAIDAGRARIQLGRWDAAAGSYLIQSEAPAEIAAFIRERSWPDPADYELLRTEGLLGPAHWPPATGGDETAPTAPSLVAIQDSDRMRLQVEIERLRAAQAARPAQLVRLEELRAHRVRLAQARTELEAARAELEEHGPLAARAAEIEPGLAGLSAAREVRDAERRQVEGARRELLAERSAARAAGERGRTPLGLGLAALGLGCWLAFIGEPLGVALAALGGSLAGLAFLRLRAARRRIGRIEAMLAAHRVRDHASERRFESETEPLRAALAALELEGIDDLRAALEAYRECAKRSADREAALAARLAELPDAEDELQRIEGALAAPDPGEQIPQLEASLARLGAPPPSPAPPSAVPAPQAEGDPEKLVAAAARGTALEPREIRARLTATLPLYLGALSAGRLTHARFRAGEGWILRGPTQPDLPFAAHPAALQAAACFAFRLALAERTAEERRVPFLIGPDLERLTREQTRVLRRLAGFVQVIRVGPPDPAWAGHAESLEVLE